MDDMMKQITEPLSESPFKEMSEEEIIEFLNKSFEHKHHPDDMYWDQGLDWIGEHASFMIMYMKWEETRVTKYKPI